MSRHLTVQTICSVLVVSKSAVCWLCQNLQCAGCVKICSVLVVSKSAVCWLCQANYQIVLAQ